MIAERFQNAAGSRRARRGDEAQFLHPVKHRRLVGVVMIIIVKRAAAEREDRKMHQRHAPHDLPRIVFQQVGKILFRRRFFRVDRLDAFLGGGESDQKQNEAQAPPKWSWSSASRIACPNADVPPAACLAANLATSGSVNPPTMNCAAFTAMKRNEFKLGALVDIAGHHAAQRRVRHVVHRINASSTWCW